MKGTLYLAISPSGKGYTGQTKKTMEERWREHVAEAFATTPKGCPKLNEAIRKYGPDSFTLMKLWECEIEDLDDWEIYFVELFESFGPRGYNLTKGGQHSAFNTSTESRQKLSDSHRTNHYDDKEMPYGITKIEGGFRVRVNDKFLRIVNAKYTDEEKYEIALSERTKLLEGTFDDTKSRRRVSEHEKDLPRHVSYDKRRDGYYVRKPGFPVRSFTSKKLEREEKLRLALECVNS